MHLSYLWPISASFYFYTNLLLHIWFANIFLLSLPFPVSFFFNFYFYFILPYNTVLVLPYIDVNPPRVYMRSQTWTPLPPPSPQHPSGSSISASWLDTSLIPGSHKEWQIWLMTISCAFSHSPHFLRASRGSGWWLLDSCYSSWAQKFIFGRLESLMAVTSLFIDMGISFHCT